ncbi:MAG: anti-sigma factor family protein [Chloroflexota bacterium]
MECLDAGRLRAFRDEQMAPDERVAAARHLQSCPDCQQQWARLAEQTDETARVLATLAPAESEVMQPAAALRTWRQRRAARPGLWQRLQGGLSAMNESSWFRGWRGVTAVLALFVVVAALVVSPAGAAFGDLLSPFRAEKFAAVTIDPAKVGTATPELSPEDVGELTVRAEPQHNEVANAAAASAAVGFPVRVPTTLPAGLEGPEFVTSTVGDGTFVFSEAKTKAALAEAGINVQLPAGFDGASARLYMPPAAGVAYMTSGEGEGGLFLLQGTSPTLELSAALDTPQMRDLFYQLSGLPPEVVDQLRAFAESKDTVPVPVIKGDAAREVQVDGVSGLLVTHRPTAVNGQQKSGSFVLWQKNGIVYALGGTVSEEALLAAANSLR